MDFISLKQVQSMLRAALLCSQFFVFLKDSNMSGLAPAPSMISSKVIKCGIMSSSVYGPLVCKASVYLEFLTVSMQHTQNPST